MLLYIAYDQYLLPPARAYHESVVLEDTMFVWGGRTEKHNCYHSRLSIFGMNMLTGVWSEHSITPPVEPPPCDEACCGIIGNTIYSFGGEISFSPYKASNELYKLNLEERQWRRVDTKGTRPEGRVGAAMCNMNGKLLLMGGHGPLPSVRRHPVADYKEDNNLSEYCGWNNELFEFDPETDSWNTVCVEGSKPCPRDGHTLTAMDEIKAVLFGGYNGEKPFNDMWLFYDEQKLWSNVTSNSLSWPQPRTLHSVCKLMCNNQGVMALLLGGFCDNITLSDCWLLDLTNCRCEKLTIDGEVFSHRGHSAGSVVLSDGTVAVTVFGGLISSSVVSNPCFFQWNPQYPSVLYCGLAPKGSVAQVHAQQVSAEVIRRARDPIEITENSQLTRLSLQDSNKTKGFEGQKQEVHKVLIRSRAVSEGENCRPGEGNGAYTPQNIVLERQKMYLTAQLEKKEKKEEELMTEIDAHKSRIRQLEGHSEELKAENEQKDQQLSNSKIHIVETAERLAQVREENADLRQKSNEQAIRIKSLEQEFAVLTINRHDAQYIQVTEMGRGQQPAAVDQTLSSPHGHLHYEKRSSDSLQGGQLQQMQCLNEDNIELTAENQNQLIHDDVRQSIHLSRENTDDQFTSVQSIKSMIKAKDDQIQQLFRENAKLKSEQVPCISGHLFLTVDTAAELSFNTLAPVTSSVSEEIGEGGGRVEFPSSNVSLVVPENAVPGSTCFCLKTYVDPRVLPPLASDDKVTLSPAFQLTSSLPKDYTFKKPLQLFLPPQVPLRAGDSDSGWLLQLKRSESTDGLPNEWHPVLQLNTKTGEVISHSSFMRYDADSRSLSLNQFSFLSWIGDALKISEGSCSLREIGYAVFGKQIQRYNWLIAVHIIHSSKVGYTSLVRKLKELGYIEFNVPNTDCIGADGEVSLKVECREPWQVQQGKEVLIKTSRIWGSAQHCSCYHQFTIEDYTRSADTLGFSIEASFKSKARQHDENLVELIISHPVSESMQRSQTILEPQGVF
jgi:hypothetical protein